MAAVATCRADNCGEDEGEPRFNSPGAKCLACLNVNFCHISPTNNLPTPPLPENNNNKYNLGVNICDGNWKHALKLGTLRESNTEW